MSLHQTPADLACVARLVGERPRDLLRFITCGSVDDGKSTLIGRLLYNSKELPDDQLRALERNSRKHGTQAHEIDLSLALDGLAAEREQGITIDVAYRFFSTERRSFIVADTPGHEEYTRNMATGASTADLAILLVDARKGLTLQTRRHALIVSMLGIRDVVLAVNKMDLVGWSQAVFNSVMAEFGGWAAELGLIQVVGIPVSALGGENLTFRAERSSWYHGHSLLRSLEEIEISAAQGDRPLRMPVQWVNRPNAGFRGFAGLVTDGRAKVGQRVRVSPSGEESTIARIVTYDGDMDEVIAGQSVTLTLADEVDVSRGCVIVAPQAPAMLANAIVARLFWMGREPLSPGASFLVKLGTQSATANLASIRSRTDLLTLANEGVSSLATNDVGTVTLRFDRPVTCDPYSLSRDTGSFILIDRESLDTIAMGLVLGEAASDRPDQPRNATTPPLRRQPMETTFRSAIKAASWRIPGTLLTIAATYAVVGNAAVALSVGGLDLVAKLPLSFGHERFWAKLGSGFSRGKS